MTYQELAHRVLCLLAAAVTMPLGGAAAAERPNIVFILADDVGIGDFGAYGQQTIPTPHLDQMAADGMAFTQMYSGAPVCSPSRAVLMTGLHNGRLSNGNNISLREEDITVAETLRAAGYQTAAFGKWHLGGSGAALPARQGFDEYFGILSAVDNWDHYQPVLQRMSSAAPNTVVSVANTFDNGQPQYTDDLFTEEAAQYIRDNADSGQPFYTQLNLQVAHFDMEVPELEPFTDGQPWPLARKVYGSMIARLDRMVGDVLRAVDDPDNDGDTSDSIADNTLIVFASDNGTHVEPASGFGQNNGPSLGVFSGEPHDPEFFDSNGVYRGWKRDVYDGGIKTPFIARWTGTIAAGTVNNALFGDFADFHPTAAELAGADAPVGVDGVSYASALTGQSSPTDQTKDFQYFEGGGSLVGAPADPARRALIRDGYKAILFNSGARELYNLVQDPAESNNLYGSMSALADEMLAIAASQDLGQVGYSTSNSTGAYRPPNANTIQTLTGGGDLTASQPVNLVGLEIGGGVSPTRLTLTPSGTLSVQNAVRVLTDSSLRLEGATAATGRRFELFGGGLEGSGNLSGAVVNDGLVTPDGGAPGSPPAPPLPVSQALVFNFAGVQDAQPLTQTSTLDPRLQLVQGLSLGNGARFRSDDPDGITSTDEGDEFNVGGFDQSSLAGAVAAEDYLTYTVQAVSGFEMHLQGVSFDLWRNGAAAANDYAILTSLDGFQSGQQIGELNNITSSGVAAVQTFAATRNAFSTTADPVEVRLYAWNADDELANTHVTDARLDAVFVLAGSSTTLELDFTGVQDDAPLTAAQVQDPRLAVVSGLQFGPGTQPRNFDGTTVTDAGDEFNPGGFDSASLAGAIVAGDYLTYTVQPVAGFEMQLVSVSYDLWRNGVNAANDYAILTSIDGFAAGDELVQLNGVTTSGPASQQTLTGFYTGGESVAGPTEVRLYAWNAADDLASTHVNAVSLNATFTLSNSSDGEPSGADLIPGRITLSGDYAQLGDGVLTLDVAGTVAGDEHDQLVVTGDASLAGMLNIALDSGYAYQPGDRFRLLTAGSVAGQFDATLLPALAGGLTLVVEYLLDGVDLVVGGVAGDFNLDGTVDAADYTVWRDTLGQVGASLSADGNRDGVIDGDDYLVWRQNFGHSAPATAVAKAIPEPGSGLYSVLAILAAAAKCRSRHRG